MNSKLFEELNDKVTETISGGTGGSTYEFKNRLNTEMNFTIITPHEVRRETLKPFQTPGGGDMISIKGLPKNILVLYDSQLGQGFVPVQEKTSPGKNVFDLTNGKIDLFGPDELIIPNLV